jgi:hypothetical protein
MNYEKSFTRAGIDKYGFRLQGSLTSYVQCYSETGILPPFFEITTGYSPKYKIEYFDYKFDDYTWGSIQTNCISNFQKLMNCYAYALQIYCNTTNTNNLPYLLCPGEFGIQQHTPSQIYSNTYNTSQYQYSSPNTSNYGDLLNEYSGYLTDLTSAPNDQAKAVKMSNYRCFIEEQMDKDAQQLNFTIERFNSNSNTFYLPNDYNENNERIIGMVTYLYTHSSPSKLDYHYYARNGNGTCQNPNHSSTCSLWTHKIGEERVSKKSGDSYYTDVICDENIGTYAFKLGDHHNYYGQEIRYYRISQDAILYNSYCEDGHNSNCTGTVYHSN